MCSSDLPVAQEVEEVAPLQLTSASLSSSSKTRVSYKGGFENVGKGTPEGDGKDKAMRDTSNGAISPSDINRKINELVNEDVFNSLTEFTNEQREQILTNFAKKHYQGDKVAALKRINEAISKDKQNTIDKLKECYL